MYEGMERFLKIVELIGKGCVESKEFQHATETQFARLEDMIKKNVLKVDFESQMDQLKDELTNTIRHSIDDFQAQINRINKKTEKAIDTLSSELKDVETNTYWKIKDYEKLLEQRPTLTFIEDYCSDLDNKMLKAAQNYTNEEIEKLLN